MLDQTLAAPPPPPEQPRRTQVRRGPKDLLFRGGVRGAGLTMLITMGLIVMFLFLRADLALSKRGYLFFTTQQWNPETGQFGIFAMLTGTLEIAVTALAVGVPIAVLAALYISEYVPPRLKRLLISLIDLMAAVP